VNRLCGSGLEAVAMAARAVRAGEGELFIAGGVESMTRAPWSMAKPGEGYPTGPPQAYDTALGWRFPNPRMQALFPLEQMGETAENLAVEYRIGREEQDAFALQSHRRAVAAQREGKFSGELVPVEVARGKGETATVAEDDGPRADTSLEKLAKLKPVFREGGTVTAGNSSSLNDGAAALLVCSEEAARARGWKPMARILASAAAGVDPRRMGIGPVPAVRKALARAGVTPDAVDLWELNEAFAAQSLAVLRDLGLPPDSPNVNPLGGAIALGHPLGCSGARILTTLVHELRRRGARIGVATMCIGVGQGIATVIERL
jgi:acetyl-CoA acetyltransferase family protein